MVSRFLPRCPFPGSSPWGFVEAGAWPWELAPGTSWASPGQPCVRRTQSLSFPEELQVDPDLTGHRLPVKLTIPGPASTLGLLLPEEKQDCTLSHLTCLPSCLQTMGDVKLAASAHVSKTSLSVDPSRVGSMPLTEAPAFILPPRNLCLREGATAKFEGRVRCGLDGRLGGGGGG